jgi:hypothetical protein
MLEVLITKPQKYAASVSSATTETATDMNSLAVGAIGVYYLNSSGVQTLVTAANVGAIPAKSVFTIALELMEVQ